MADTTFVDDTTVIVAAWLNDINDFYYTLFNGDASAVTDGDILVGDGTKFVRENGATARTSLGLGSVATQASSAVAITGGTVTGITDLAVADGGTGSSTAVAARAALGANGNLLSVQDFSASGTWTRPSGCLYVRVEAVGGGGGGGGVDGVGTDTGSGGGGAAGAGGSTSLVDVSAISSSTITIGAAGTGGSAGANSGSAGGDTIWSDGTNTFTWGGGSGGLGVTVTGSTILYYMAAGGIGTGTGLLAAGAMGGPASLMAIQTRSGSGASSIWGVGALNSSANGSGPAATGYGAGGAGGCVDGSAANYGGGAGTIGYMRVWEYY